MTRLVRALIVIEPGDDIYSQKHTRHSSESPLVTEILPVLNANVDQITLRLIHKCIAWVALRVTADISTSMDLHL